MNLKTPLSEIKKVRNLLSAKANEYCDDHMADRYIRATSGNIEKASKRIENSVKWRFEIKPEEVVCEACQKDPGAHYMNVVGFCKKQRPVVYSCMALSRDRNIIYSKQHLINKFEQAIKMMDDDNVEQWIWFSDLYGFNHHDLNPSMAKAFLHMTSEYYPERLGVFFIVGAPRIFEYLWRLLKPLLEPVTAEKIVFLSYDNSSEEKRMKMKNNLMEYFDEEMSEWLIREMAENRDKNKKSKSAPNVKVMYKSASEQSFEMIEPHDSRGTTSLLKKYMEDPSLLLPQALTYCEA